MYTVYKKFAHLHNQMQSYRYRYQIWYNSCVIQKTGEYRKYIARKLPQLSAPKETINNLSEQVAMEHGEL